MIQMRTARKILLTIGVVTMTILGVGVYSFFFDSVHATAPPNISTGSPATPCMNSGTRFTTSITVSNLTNTYSWQLNITFTGVRPMNWSLGPLFPTSQTGIVASKNNTGFILAAFTFYNGGSPITTTSQTVLIKVTWTTTSYEGPISFHIVTRSENAYLGSELLDPSQNLQSYTTTNYYGCGSPNISIPDLSGHCFSNGALFSTVVSASNMSSIGAWQLNVTFDTDIAAVSYSMGTAFTGSNTRVTNTTRNNTGSILINFTYTNGATETTVSQVTMVTITWKALQTWPVALLHIVLSSENSRQGTYLWGTSHQQSETYTTTDGFVSCGLNPGH